jgi:hypothetical protein
MAVRGKVKNGKVVLQNPKALPEGTEVEVRGEETEACEQGSQAQEDEKEGAAVQLGGSLARLHR